MKWIGIFGIVLTCLGSIFAGYDNFIFGYEFNNKYLPICNKWNDIIGKIEPYTIDSREPIENLQAFLLFQQGDNNFKMFQTIIRLNYRNRTNFAINKIIIHVPIIQGGTRLGGQVNLEHMNGDRAFLASPDIVVQWINQYRKNWFLKWGLMLIAAGSFMQIMWRLMQRRWRINMDEKRLKRNLAFMLFIVTAAFAILAVFFSNNQESFRFFMCITFFSFGLGTRAAFYPIFFKNDLESNLPMSQIAKAYVYYFLITISISCLVYLSFYDTFNKMSKGLFYLMALFLFMPMGVMIRSVIKKLS